MQIPIYMSNQDYETLTVNRPEDFQTTAQFIADIVRKKAESYREKTTEKTKRS